LSRALQGQEARQVARQLRLDVRRQIERMVIGSVEEKMMRIRNTNSFVLISLLVLAAACSRTETETQSQSPLEEADRPAVDQAGGEPSVAASLASVRSETCEPSETVGLRIRELEVRLNRELLPRYTEQHPEVIATRQELERLERQARDECVERLQ
jgi:hypothetical protein